MWCQVEIETDGGILGRISPFVAMSLVPQMTPYHNKLSAAGPGLLQHPKYCSNTQHDKDADILSLDDDDKGQDKAKNNQHYTRNDTQATNVISLAITSILLYRPVCLTQDYHYA